MFFSGLQPLFQQVRISEDSPRISENHICFISLGPSPQLTGQKKTSSCWSYLPWYPHHIHIMDAYIPKISSSHKLPSCLGIFPIYPHYIPNICWLYLPLVVYPWCLLFQSPGRRRTLDILDRFVRDRQTGHWNEHEVSKVMQLAGKTQISDVPFFVAPGEQPAGTASSNQLIRLDADYKKSSQKGVYTQ